MIEDNYEDIIDLLHYEPKHPRMSRYNRAAQFAPFAALTGYEKQIEEASRLTDKKIDIDEELKIILNNKLQIIQKNIHNKPRVEITYFVKDKLKSGGLYTKVNSVIKKIDNVNKLIILDNNLKINIGDVINIQSEDVKLD